MLIAVFSVESSSYGKHAAVKQAAGGNDPKRDADVAIADELVVMDIEEEEDDYEEDIEDLEDDEEEEEGDEENQETEQEIGPPLLTPLSDDVEVGGLPPWSANLSSGLSLIQHAICIIKSNLWPGAFAFSNGQKFENVYIGYGQKFVNENYSPPQPQAFANEYGASPNCEEDHDPTVEEETALKQANEADEGEEGEDEEEDDEEE